MADMAGKTVAKPFLLLSRQKRYLNTKVAKQYTTKASSRWGIPLFRFSFCSVCTAADGLRWLEPKSIFQ